MGHLIELKENFNVTLVQKVMSVMGLGISIVVKELRKSIANVSLVLILNMVFILLKKECIFA